MRKISHFGAIPIGALSAMPIAAWAQSDTVTPIIVPSQSSIYNQNSVNLPPPPTINGQDVVRGVTGASCQSSVTSGGPYLDLGVIGSQDVFNRDTASVYGRIVVPLGERPKRLDCTKLYELEIARLRIELDLFRLGAPVPPTGVQLPVEQSAVKPASAELQSLVIPSKAAPAAQAPSLKPDRMPKTASVLPASTKKNLAADHKVKSGKRLRDGAPI